MTIPSDLAPEITSTLRTIADAIERGDAGAETALAELGRSIEARRLEPPADVASAEFYILSLKHDGDFMLWWRPNFSGYTLFLEAAGRYPADVVLSKLSYLNDGETTRAIPCHVAETHARKAVYSDYRRHLIAAAVPSNGFARAALAKVER
jgi:hypothetical protein